MCRRCAIMDLVAERATRTFSHYTYYPARLSDERAHEMYGQAIVAMSK